MTAVDADEIPEFGSRFLTFTEHHMGTEDLDALRQDIRRQIKVGLPVLGE